MRTKCYISQYSCVSHNQLLETINMLWYPRIKWITISSIVAIVIGLAIWWLVTDGDRNQLFDYLVYTGIGSILLGFLSMAGSSEAWYSEHEYSIESQNYNIHEMLNGLPFSLIPVFGGALILIVLFIFYVLTSQ